MKRRTKSCWSMKDPWLALSKLALLPTIAHRANALEPLGDVAAAMKFTALDASCAAEHLLHSPKGGCLISRSLLTLASARNGAVCSNSFSSVGPEGDILRALGVWSQSCIQFDRISAPATVESGDGGVRADVAVLLPWARCRWSMLHGLDVGRAIGPNSTVFP